MSEDLQYPAFDEKTGKVICQICGKPFLVISPRHLLKHNVIYTDYTRRYPSAPLSSKEFSAKTKYGKVKDLFAPKPLDDELEEVIVNEEPKIEDSIDVDKILKEKSQFNPIKQVKAQALDTLKTYFTNIRQDYIIEEYGQRDKRLKYQFVTDFTDPILRIVVQFPDTFWHNRDASIDLMKNEKLRSDGWKVLIIKGKSPTIKNIQEVVDNM